MDFLAPFQGTGVSQVGPVSLVKPTPNSTHAPSTVGAGYRSEIGRTGDASCRYGVLNMAFQVGYGFHQRTHAADLSMVDAAQSRVPLMNIPCPHWSSADGARLLDSSM